MQLNKTDSIELIKEDPGYGFTAAVYCPHCQKSFWESRYLRNQFPDKNTRWLANMITHWRHVHTNWDKSKYKLNGNKGIYEKDKIAVNEYIKQVIIKKYAEFLKSQGITSEHFKRLLNTNSQTINLAERLL